MPLKTMEVLNSIQSPKGTWGIRFQPAFCPGHSISFPRRSMKSDLINQGPCQILINGWHAYYVIKSGHESYNIVGHFCDLFQLFTSRNSWIFFYAHVYFHRCRKCRNLLPPQLRTKGRQAAFSTSTMKVESSTKKTLQTFVAKSRVSNATVQSIPPILCYEYVEVCA